MAVPLCVAFEVVIGFFSLLSEASEPITKLLGNFFVVEIFRRVSWFRIKSGSVSLSRFDLWLVVVDPSERRTAPGAIFSRTLSNLRNFFFKSGTSVGIFDFGKSWAKNHWSRKPLVSSPSLNNDDSPSCPVLGGAAIPPWRLLEGRPSTRKIKD